MFDVNRDTYGDLEADWLIANLSVDHRGLQERPKEEKFLHFSGSRLLRNIQEGSLCFLFSLKALELCNMSKGQT